MKNVLLVDDDNIFNFLNTKLLRLSGIANEIHTAENGKEAIELLNNYYAGTSSLPDVILLDLNMPVMDGFAFIKAFQKLNIPRMSDVRIVVVTSSADPRDMERVRQLGVTNFLTKPISEQMLLGALEDSVKL